MKKAFTKIIETCKVNKLTNAEFIVDYGRNDKAEWQRRSLPEDMDSQRDEAVDRH